MEAKALMSDIVEILIGDADERRQFVFQHANDSCIGWTSASACAMCSGRRGK
jgi:hypothetical protein